MQVFPLLMPQAFVNRFVFIWGHEHCTKILGQLTTKKYYLKYLKPVYFACQGLPYGIEDCAIH